MALLRHIAPVVAGLLWLAPVLATPQFPALTGRVVDDANLLDSGAQSHLIQRLAQHERETSNQIVVVTLPGLQGYTIEDFGYQLGRHWGIGQEGKDNGVLLIVAPRERKVRIEVAYGLEGVLTDAYTSAIIQQEILPYFRENKFPQGIVNGVDKIIATLQGTYEPEPENHSLNGLLFFLLIVFIIFVIWSENAGGGPRGRIRRRAYYYPGHYGGHHGGGFGGGSSRGGFRGGGGSFGGGGASGGW